MNERSITSGAWPGAPSGASSPEASSGARLREAALAAAPAGYDPARDGLCIHRRGRVLFCGGALASLLGRPEATADALVGGAVADWFPESERAGLTALVDWPLPPVPQHAVLRLLGGARVDVTSAALPVVGAELGVLHFGAARPVGEGEPPRAAQAAAPAAARPAVAAPPRVIVCDDETRLASLTAGLLADSGFSAAVAARGEEVLAAADAAGSGVDLVLLDVNLARGLRAIDVVEGLAARGAGTRVVLTSGLAEEDVAPALRAAPGVVGYVGKPYALERLVETLRRALAP